jgi:hypothetical protein
LNAIKLDSGVTFLQAAEGESAPGPKRFRIVAYTGSQIRQGWSREPVVIDVAGMQLPATVPVVLGHDYTLGSILGQGRPFVENGQIIVEGEILAKNGNADQVLALAEAGYQFQASVGADVRRHQKIDADAVTQVNGTAHIGPVRIVKASSLREVSFCTLGADSQTSVAIAAEEVAEEFSMAADATQKPTDEVVETPVVAATAEVAVESPKVEASVSEELKAAIETLTQKVEQMQKLNATRDERPAAPAVHVTHNVAPTAEVIEAAFCLQGGLPNVEKHYNERTLEAAHKASRTVSLGEVLVSAAEANGYDGPRRLTASTLRPILQAAWATHSISGILSATVNKFLLAGFNSVEDSWRQIASTRSLSDLKTYTSYRLNSSMKFQKVAPGGELKSAGVSDESRTISADTYGIMSSVDRTSLLNDDMSALTAMPTQVGRGGSLALNDLFWDTFKADGSFFTVARGNKKTSATALSIAGLKEAVTLFRKLKDAKGNPVAVQPRILLVPVELEVTAAELMGSTQIASGNTNGQPSTNVFAGRYQVVSSTYLTDASDYYLLASPADLATMEVAFLNGQQTPVVETADADFSVLGIQFRGFWDVGVAQAEYLGGVKMDV